MSANKEPTVAEARAARKELQSSIAKLVHGYMETYSVQVTSIDLETISVGHPQHRELYISGLRVEVEL